MLAGEAMGELVQAPGELNALMRESGADEEADGARVLLREMRLTCQKTRGQGFVLRQQLHEYGNADIITGTHQEAGDQLSSIKKNNWFRAA